MKRFIKILFLLSCTTEIGKLLQKYNCYRIYNSAEKNIEKFKEQFPWDF